MSDSYEVDLSGLDFVVGMMREAPARISYEKLHAERDQLKALLKSSAVAKELIAARAELVGLKAENERLKKKVEWAEAVSKACDESNLRAIKQMAIMHAQLDEANAALAAKNARIHVYAERHLVDFAELEKLDGQLDEARELLKRAVLYIPSAVPMAGEVYEWVERNKA